MWQVGLMVLGIIAGILSGLLGIGGGIIMVPGLVHFFGISQKLAHGTTLAVLLAPISLASVMVYHRSGYLDIGLAVLLGVGFVTGNFLGAKYAISLPDYYLRKAFAAFLIAIGLWMLTSNPTRP
jgi:uncharacterized membrane protein YfcA